MNNTDRSEFESFALSEGSSLVSGPTVENAIYMRVSDHERILAHSRAVGAPADVIDRATVIQRCRELEVKFNWQVAGDVVTGIRQFVESLPAAATTSSPAAQPETATIYADGFCARCSELAYPLTRALEKTGVPTGADRWQQTYGPNKVKALDDLHTCLRQLLFALKDGDPKKINERIDHANMRIEFYAEVYRRLNKAAQDAAASEGEQE